LYIYISAATPALSNERFSDSTVVVVYVVFVILVVVIVVFSVSRIFIT